MSEIIDITAVEAKERFDDGWKPYVIDVRGDMESSAFGQLGFTDLQQEYDEIHEIIDELPRDRDLLLYCRSGARSSHACVVLGQLGFDQLYNLDGGINGWSHFVDPSVKAY